MKPQMNTDRHRLNHISEKIIGCAFSVSNALGAGFLEKVYQAQLLNYLKATNLSLGLLINFGTPKIKRIIND